MPVGTVNQALVEGLNQMVQQMLPTIEICAVKALPVIGLILIAEIAVSLFSNIALKGDIKTAMVDAGYLDYDAANDEWEPDIDDPDYTYTDAEGNVYDQDWFDYWGL